MITFPNAKINLGLFVGETRPDGYHNLETLFYPLKNLCDVLEIVPAESEADDTFTLTGLEVAGKSEDNLVMKAVRLVRERYAVPPLNIFLRKQIPTGAGMGGGSADASFAIKMLNEMFALGMNNEEMKAMARRLGADCPFFIDNVPSLAFGIGDELQPIDVDLSRYHILVVKPPVFVSTAEAYRGVPVLENTKPIAESIKQDVSTWKDTLLNSFEVNVFERFDELEYIKQELYDCGAVFALMSGSGSALFALFEEKKEMLQNRYLLRDYFCQWG